MQVWESFCSLIWCFSAYYYGGIQLKTYFSWNNLNAICFLFHLKQSHSSCSSYLILGTMLLNVFMIYVILLFICTNNSTFVMTYLVSMYYALKIKTIGKTSSLWRKWFYKVSLGKQSATWCVSILISTTEINWHRGSSASHITKHCMGVPAVSSPGLLAFVICSSDHCPFPEMWLLPFLSKAGRLLG